MNIVDYSNVADTLSRRRKHLTYFKDKPLQQCLQYKSIANEIKLGCFDSKLLLDVFELVYYQTIPPTLVVISSTNDNNIYISTNDTNEMRISGSEIYNLPFMIILTTEQMQTLFKPHKGIEYQNIDVLSISTDTQLVYKGYSPDMIRRVDMSYCYIDNFGK